MKRTNVTQDIIELKEGMLIRYNGILFEVDDIGTFYSPKFGASLPKQILTVEGSARIRKTRSRF